MSKTGLSLTEHPVNLITNIHGGTRFMFKLLRLLGVKYWHQHTHGQALGRIIKHLDGRPTIFVTRSPDDVADTVFREKVREYGEIAPRLTCDLVVEWFYNLKFFMEYSPTYYFYRVGDGRTLPPYEGLLEYLKVEGRTEAKRLVVEQPKIGHNTATESLPSIMTAAKSDMSLARLNTFKQIWETPRVTK